MKLLNLALALAGLAAFVASSPVETTANAATKYKNDGVNTYKCESKMIVLSCVASGTYSFVEKCSTKCVADRQGAGCTGSATATAVESPEKRDIDTEVNTEDKKTYECSNDHTGVLVCQYGFCQTDHYCKKGTKCRDKCSCCRNIGVLERDIDDLDTTRMSEPQSDVAAGNDVQALTVVESDTLASRANAPCVPGTYTCAMNPSTGTAWIVVCGWNGVYQYSSNCGGMKCLSDDTGVAHCWNTGKEWDSGLLSVTRRGELQDPYPSNAQLDCQPGSLACTWRDDTQTSWIITCDQSGHNWVCSANCGHGMACDQSNGLAHCIPQKPTLGARDELLKVPSELAPALDCHPGEFGCSWNKATMTEWVLVCDQSGHRWQWSSDCGKGMKCVQGGGVAHCVAQNALFESPNTVQSPDLVTRQDPNSCAHPDEVACNDHIVVRCENGHWTEIQNCGSDLICAIHENRVPHCIPPMAIAASTLATMVVGAAASAKA